MNTPNYDDQWKSTPTPPPPNSIFSGPFASPLDDVGTYKGQAVTSLVLGCVSVFFFWLWAVIPILAIIFGGVAISGAKRHGRKPNGMAIAGLVLGIIFTALFALFFAVGVAVSG